jgi:heterodisulfide reductase subunit C/nitrate reductase gamma subunit
MLFDLLLYGSLCIFLLGTAWRVFTWFSRGIGPGSREIPPARRARVGLLGAARTLFSGNILTVFRVVLVDGLLQWRILKEDLLRWVMHFSIFAGFTLLLLMHALDDLITANLFESYYSTVNPWFFLRDLAGVLVLLGLVLAVLRRTVLKVPRLRTRSRDVVVLVLLALIVVSGFLLEGAKIGSHEAYQRMVEEWADPDATEEVRALESYWIQELGLYATRLSPPFSEAVLAEGRELHEMNCAFCHAPSQWAFASYGANRAMAPLASFLSEVDASLVLWHVHILACFVGLAYLPFSKLFHVIATPVGLVVSALTDRERSDPANVATRQAVELDACTQCGTCSLRCSQVGAAEVLANPCILPSERMASLRRAGRKDRLEPAEREAIRRGAVICSNCDRCTVVCPSGINLKELWMCVREELIQQGDPEPALLSPFSFFRGLRKHDLEALADYARPLQRALHTLVRNGRAEAPEAEPPSLDLTGREERAGNPDLEAGHFADCFGCRTCTSVCPVVGNYEDPVGTLGLLPHQVMYCLALGMPDMASRARMLWDCATCYQCEEHCPQGVRVTDIFYTLKNRAAREQETRSGASPEKTRTGTATTTAL